MCFWRQRTQVHNPVEATIYKFLNVCSVYLIKNKAPIGANLDKKKEKSTNGGYFEPRYGQAEAEISLQIK